MPKAAKKVPKGQMVLVDAHGKPLRAKTVSKPSTRTPTVVVVQQPAKRAASKKPAKKSGSRGGALNHYIQTHGGTPPWAQRSGTGPTWIVMPRNARGTGRKPRATVRAGAGRGGLPGTSNPSSGAYMEAAKQEAVAAPVALVSFVAPAAVAAAVGGSVTRQTWARRITAGALIVGGVVVAAMGHPNVGAGMTSGGLVSAVGNEIMGRVVSFVFDMRAKVLPEKGMDAVVNNRGQQIPPNQIPQNMRAVDVGGRQILPAGAGGVRYARTYQPGMGIVVRAA